MLLEADVEPHGAVEGGLLMKQDVGELGLEGVGVLVGVEVVAVTSPAGDRAGDAGDHLLDRALALVGADAAAEVLLGDDVGRVLRPRLRELDAALLEGGVRRVADDGIAELPLDLVEGVHPRGRVTARAATGLHRSAFAVFAALSGILYLLFSSNEPVSSGNDALCPALRTESADGETAKSGFGVCGASGVGSVPRNCRYAP